MGYNSDVQPFHSKGYYFFLILSTGVLPVLFFRHSKFPAISLRFFDYLSVLCLLTFYLLIKSSSIDELIAQLVDTRISSESGTGLVVNPITIGRISVIIICVNIGRLIYLEQKVKNVIFQLLITLLAFIFLVLSGSRAPLLICVFNFILLLPKKLNLTRAVELLFLVILIYVIFLMVADEVFLVQRVLELFQGNLGKLTQEERWYQWTVAIHQFLSSPLLGDRFYEVYLNQYPHNVLIESFMALGLLGGLVFSIIYFGALRRLSWSFWKLEEGVLMRPILSTVLLSSLLSGSLYFNSELWACLLYAVTRHENT
jgi:hypothetical protein